MVLYLVTCPSRATRTCLLVPERRTEPREDAMVSALLVFFVGTLGLALQVEACVEVFINLHQG